MSRGVRVLLNYYAIDREWAHKSTSSEIRRTNEKSISYAEQERAELIYGVRTYRICNGIESMSRSRQREREERK